MTALNSAVQLLRDVDPRILSGAVGASFGGTQGIEFDHCGAPFSITFGFGVGLEADWIYAADFAAQSNAIFLGSYSGRVVELDSAGEARQVYDFVRIPAHRI